MSAVLSGLALTRLGQSSEVPLFLRVVFLAAKRADTSGVAAFGSSELSRLLRHEGEVLDRNPGSVNQAIRRAVRGDYLRDGSDAEQLHINGNLIRRADAK